MQVTVVGLGYVGLVTSACLAGWGNVVTGLESNPVRLGRLRLGEMPFHEPGLADDVRANVQQGRLAFTAEVPLAIANAEVVVIGVGTHDGNGGWQTETVRHCLSSIVPAMRDDAVLVIRSTLPPDFVVQLRGLISKLRSPDRPTLPVLINPEFTREGTALQDFRSPDRVVIGVVDDPTGRGVACLRDLYSSIDAPIVIMDGIDAALCKLGSNLFLATKISFANELASVCELFGGDVEQVVHGMSYDNRIGGRFLRAGIGFGGSCLPNQVAMMVRTARRFGVEPHLFAAVDEVNHELRGRFVERIAAVLSDDLAGKRVSLLGLSFKPFTDDVRDAPALTIADALIRRGAEVVAYDPNPAAGHQAVRQVVGLVVVESMEAALAGADVAALVTEWPEFVGADWGALKHLMRQPIVIDGRNALDAAALRKLGFAYADFGRRSPDRVSVAMARMSGTSLDGTPGEVRNALTSPSRSAP